MYRVIGADIPLGLVEHDPSDGPFDPRRVGLDHFAVSVRNHDLDVWAKQLAARGITHSAVADVPLGPCWTARTLMALPSRSSGTGTAIRRESAPVGGDPS